MITNSHDPSNPHAHYLAFLNDLGLWNAFQDTLNNNHADNGQLFHSGNIRRWWLEASMNSNFTCYLVPWAKSPCTDCFHIVKQFKNSHAKAGKLHYVFDHYFGHHDNITNGWWLYCNSGSSTYSTLHVLQAVWHLLTS